MIQILTPFVESKLPVNMALLCELCTADKFGKKSLKIRKKIADLTLGADIPDPEKEPNCIVFYKLLFRFHEFALE